jgi:glycosyltransferase involved in cell wall biosynthesis
MNIKEPLVSICCTTYNHEKYIRDSIEGFLIQKTTFPIEIIIHDDASTDNTALIVKEYADNYPELIIPIFQTENQYSKGIKPFYNYILPLIKGKYIAFCEGDDYWIDPYKLQKQVDILEANPEYSLCVSGYKKYNVYTKEEEDNINIPSGVKLSNLGYTFTLDYTKKGWITKTLTALFRNDISMLNKLSRYKYGKDVNLFYHLLKNGEKGFYFTEIMGVYRVHEGGIYSMKPLIVIINSAYHTYKELYQINKDEYTRYMNLMHTLTLLNYNLFNNYTGNSLKIRINLYVEIILLVKSIKEIRFLLTVFIPEKIKSKIKSQFYY